MQSRYGRLNFDEVLQPAIRLAKDGFPVSSFFVAMTRASIGRIKDPEWQRVFRVEQDWQTGQVLQLSDLAATLEQIAYPEHNHPPPELYLTLSGTAEWRYGGCESYRTVSAGNLLYNNPHDLHGVRAGDTPLLALYLLWHIETV